uniref:SH3 domain-containing protein n=1 Tax=Pavo cristatus TaxID=9049 RepID=A0A8C9LBT5_PAVCR
MFSVILMNLLCFCLVCGFFSRQKALVATGQKSIEDAAKWLHSHCNDPSLDDPIPQEYALYLCPTGHLYNCLQEFWKESKRQCGKNRAHEIFPHITLCDFFTSLPCSHLYLPAQPLLLPDTLHLLHLKGANSSLVALFLDCHVKPCLKQLHLTLAHKFCPHHQKTLEQLAKCINPEETCHWVAALYSRDMRFVHYQTLRALFQYKPQNIDELMINAGDFIYVNPTQQSEVSKGWVIGTSHQSGCRGFLPENYTERANESDTWVKHREYAFVPASKFFTQSTNEPNVKLNGEVHNPVMSRSVTDVLSLQVVGILFLIFHFEHDPPLSSCGVFQSRLIGEALLDQEVTVSYVYSSPALRCVQTAQHVLQGLKLDQKVKIRVEPGLFEWTKWEASRVIPNFMTLTELTEASYNIDTSYRGNIPLSSLVPSESYEEYVSRSSAVVKEIITACPSKGVILIVGHGSSLASFTRPLIGLPARDSSDFAQVVRKIPSLGMCFCEELKEEKKWLMVNPPVKTLTHGANAAFNWRNSIMED